MAQQDTTFDGVWFCGYWYPSNNHDGEDLSEYYATIHQKGNKLVIQSLPNKTESYMVVRLTLDGDLATGSWQEHTSPEGEFKGATYGGVLELLLSDDKTHMQGMWVGDGQDNGKKRIYSGRWELRRTGKKMADLKKSA